MTLAQRNIYLDCNATHPLLPSVRSALADAISRGDAELANPASIHRDGQRAKRVVAELRAALCRALGRGDGDEFILLSGATEAINLAARGFFDERVKAGRTPRFVAATVDHNAILETTEDLESARTLIPVDQSGALDEGALMAVLEQQLADPKVDVLLCLQGANNETGVAFNFETLLPKLAAWTLKKPQRVWILLDAAQALGKLDDSLIRRLVHAVDYVALSAHKIGGPTGIGTLWVRPQSPFRRQMAGGTQERKRRAGTLNIIGAYGFQLALQDWAQHGDAHRAKLANLRASIVKGIQSIPGACLHGVQADGTLPALPNTINFHIEGCPEESLVLALDIAGFSVSSGSACNSGTLKPSHVLLAMGYPVTDALSSVRVCVGIETTEADVQAFVHTLSEKVEHIRRSRKLAAEFLPNV